MDLYREVAQHKLNAILSTSPASNCDSDEAVMVHDDDIIDHLERLESLDNVSIHEVDPLLPRFFETLVHPKSV